jgi:hypothetical protein
MHSPEEPARPHFTWNLSRKAGGVLHSRNRNAPRSRLGETGPCPRIRCGQNTSYRATIQAVFLRGSKTGSLDPS